MEKTEFKCKRCSRIHEKSLNGLMENLVHLKTTHGVPEEIIYDFIDDFRVKDLKHGFIS